MSNFIQIKNILEKYNKTPKKSLGQNFLIDAGLSEKIASLGAFADYGVLEIGAGLGILTGELCGVYKNVTAVEIDRGLEPILKENLDGHSNLRLIFGDILDADLAALFPGTEKVNVCANLPYCITTPIMLKLMKCGVKFENIIVMVQKEAADKICAKTGNALSVIAGYYGGAKKMFVVPKSSFYPQPKVNSAVVKITRHSKPAAVPKNEELMYKVIGAAFRQRRKTLVNALVSGLALDKSKITAIVTKITGNENIRGEDLDVTAFADISDMIYMIFEGE